MNRYFLAYSTANDDPTFLADYLNFVNMTIYLPGVTSIEVFIAISEVIPITPLQQKIISALKDRLTSCCWLNVHKIIYKSNVGRDFSSAHACLNEISKIAKKEDYVMVKNRSGYGPIKSSWYKAYIEQYNKLTSEGLVGSTINFDYYKRISKNEIFTHVQSYIYLTKFKVIAPLILKFPGITCIDQDSLIYHGEIALSKYILKNGMQLSCLHWPNHIFDKKNPTDPLLPQGDIKGSVKDVPFRHRFRNYFRYPDHLLLLLKWQIRIMIRKICNKYFDMK